MLKKVTLSLILLSAFSLIGCNSTPSTNAATAQATQQSDHPTISLTVVAQKLTTWPYNKSMLTYTLNNKNIVEAKDADVLNSWKQHIEVSINNQLTNNIGMTKVQDPKAANIEVIYGLTAAAAGSVNSDKLFDNLGLTTGSTRTGSDSAIDIVIKDRRSNSVLWTGVVSATSDKPIKDEYKAKIIDNLVDSLIKKLPVAQ